MISKLLYLLILAASPLFTTDVKNAVDSHRIHQNSSTQALGRSKRQALVCGSDDWQCNKESCIDINLNCDGLADCPGGRHDTVKLCLNMTSPQQNSCTLPEYPADGKYITNILYKKPGADYEDINIIVDCSSGAAEGSNLIRCINGVRITPHNITDHLLPNSACHLPSDASVEYRCLLPGYTGKSRTCKEYEPPGTVVRPQCRGPQYYSPDDLTDMRCDNGNWNHIATCLPAPCPLTMHPSVEYQCLVSGLIEGYRNCQEYEPAGTVVRPQCNSPNYYSPVPLTYMRCDKGRWDYVAKCIPECGTVTPVGTELIIGGKPAKRAEVPWHVAVYTKTKLPYEQICGGSLISNTIVISAAHCFWNSFESKQFPTSDYAVAAGKLFRPWGNTKDQAQKSDVKEIHVPSRFQGSLANYQDDIAVVIVSTPFVFKAYIRPVCVDFDILFEKTQLYPGKYGKVAGWGLTSENGNQSQVLQVIDLPYVSIATCLAEAPPDFRAYITGDKVCAGVNDKSKALCKGDSGGGLAFAGWDRGIERYYLRGIVSTAPGNQHKCNANAFTSFTLLLKHEHFVKQFWASAAAGVL